MQVPGPGWRLMRNQSICPTRECHLVPITQEKLKPANIGLVPRVSLSFLSLVHLSLSGSRTHVDTPIRLTAKTQGCSRSRQTWSTTSLQCTVCVCVFLTAANTHARPFQTQPASLLCDREANLLRQNTLPSRHATLAPFHQPAYYIRISLHACHNNTFTTNECGAFCPKLAVTCLSKGHKQL